MTLFQGMSVKQFWWCNVYPYIIRLPEHRFWYSNVRLVGEVYIKEDIYLHSAAYRFYTYQEFVEKMSFTIHRK